MCYKSISIYIQYIPGIIHMVCHLLYFVVVWYQSILSISIRVNSLALGQSYDCPSASEVTLKNMGKCMTWIYKHQWLNGHKDAQQNHVHILFDTQHNQWQGHKGFLGLNSLRRHSLIGIGIHIINLPRWLSDCLRLIMGIPIPARQCCLVN